MRCGGLQGYIVFGEVELRGTVMGECVFVLKRELVWKRA